MNVGYAFHLSIQAPESHEWTFPPVVPKMTLAGILAFGESALDRSPGIAPRWPA